jgi:hypothetical protein
VAFVRPGLLYQTISLMYIFFSFFCVLLKLAENLICMNWLSKVVLRHFICDRITDIEKIAIPLFILRFCFLRNIKFPSLYHCSMTATIQCCYINIEILFDHMYLSTKILYQEPVQNLV